MEKVTLVTDPAHPVADGLGLCPGVNLLNGKKEFEREFGELTSLEEDLLNLGAAIFASDLAIKRGERENLPRNIELTIPVINLAAFRGVSDEITGALYVLSHDAWKLNFVQQNGKPEEARMSSAKEEGKVLLFSGGLDSLSGAITLADAGQKVQLVSHTTANQVIYKTQDSLFAYLENQYPQQFRRIAVRVSGVSKPTKGFLFPSDSDREDTQRTRSFMFLSLAALVARRRGYQDVVMIAENGQMAIHLPLSAARISAFSTHTAHPEFVVIMSEVLSKILNYQIVIENPFLYLTKSEVVSRLFPQHKSVVEQTVSCWRASRVSKTYRHCGTCIPCLIRRISLESNHLSLPEYQRDLLQEKILSLPPEDDGKRNITELCEFISTFGDNLSLAELQMIYPDLINQYFNVNQAVSMYRRFAQEARFVFQNYPEVLSLMG